MAVFGGERAVVLAQKVEEELASRAVKADAKPMQRYMKSELPFFGAKKPLRVQIYRDVVGRDKPADAAAYVALVQALWNTTHRETKYASQFFAGKFRAFHTMEHVPLYTMFITEGRWWDFVDNSVGKIISPMLYRGAPLVPLTEQWLVSNDMWLRRAAMLSQLKCKEKVDSKRLFRFADALLAEQEFFIRKAIGWALRDYSYQNPVAVTEYLKSRRERLSGLSYREGAKALRRSGVDL